jgi:signal transduction histidine kinase
VAFKKQLVEQGHVRDLEVCIRRKDGQLRTFLASAELVDVHGEPCSLSVIADITERKQAEEVLSSVSRRLIEAQEEERTRIARELHDDINQRVALVSVTLECLRQGLPNLAIEARSRLEETKEQMKNIGNDIQALSHRLHSSKLDYLGLVAACRGFCRELSERQGVEVRFESENVPKHPPREVSLCLFRVLQEALQNAVKYSGVREFQVSLKVTGEGIVLCVRDSGAGFDLETAVNGQGLGLTSMRERMKLVDGALSIDSTPGRGTTVCATAPLKISVAAAAAN